MERRPYEARHLRTGRLEYRFRPERDCSPRARAFISIHAFGPFEPTGVKRPAAVFIDGKQQSWSRAGGGHWQLITPVRGLHALELVGPISPNDDGELAEVQAVLEPGVEIDIQEGGWLSGTGRPGPRCLIIDADETTTTRFGLCHGNDDLPARRPIDLHAKGACLRPAMSGGEFMVTMKGPSGTLVDGDSLAFLDMAPGAYVVRPTGGKLRLEFRPDPALCKFGSR